MSEQDKRQQEKDRRVGGIVFWSIIGLLILIDWIFNDLRTTRELWRSMSKGFRILWQGYKELNDWLMGLVF